MNFEFQKKVNFWLFFPPVACFSQGDTQIHVFLVTRTSGPRYTPQLDRKKVQEILLLRYPPPGWILWVDPKSRTRRKRTAREDQPPNLIWGSESLGVVCLETTHPTPMSLVYPLSVFRGKGFLQSNFRKKGKSKIIEERFETETFQKKYFSSRSLRISPERKKERKKSP